jgi:hypothetical protein
LAASRHISRSGHLNGSFINGDQKQQAGGDRPRRLIERRNKMTHGLVLLPLMIVFLTIEVKVIVRIIVKRR